MKHRLFFMLAAFSLSAYSQPWASILNPSRAIDWSNAGAVIPTTRTQCGSTVAAGTSAATINTLLSGCASGTYLLLGSGTFNLSAGLSVPSNVTLRGSGANSTFLVFSAGVSCGGAGNFNICVQTSDRNYWGGPTNTATWSGTASAGTYNKGDTQVILSSVTNLKVGNTLILDQIDDQSDTGALYVGCERPDGSTNCYSGAGPSGFQRGGGALATIRGQQQMVKVTNIAGSGPYTVGITPGIYAANWQTSHSPGAWWATTVAQNAGIENLSIDSTTDGAQSILFFNAQNCWVKGVRAIISSGTVATGWFHVGMWMSNHMTVRDSYFFGTKGDSYVVSVGVASDVLVENNIMQYPSYYQLWNSDCEGCVSGYNFSASTMFSSGGTNWLEQPSGFHSTTLFGLSEGNISAGHYGDAFHGTHNFETFFRNRMDGREQDGKTATTSNTLAVLVLPGSRYYNMVGNILGTVGYHNAYKCTTTSCSNYGTSIYNLGVNSGVADSLTNSTSMFWGNWDTASNGVRWCGNSSDPGWATTCGSASEVPTGLGAYANAVPASTSLPASFYYSSQPAWWPSGKTWPPIGPDVTGGNVGQCRGGTEDSNEVIASHSSLCTSGTVTALPTVTSIPAMDCYFNTMSGGPDGTGSALSFDANLCYAPSGTGIAPPTALSTTVH